MSTGSTDIAIDFDALDRHTKAVDEIAGRLSAAIDAGRTTGGFNSAHAFGLMCAGMNVPATIFSQGVVGALSASQDHLRAVTDRARAGAEDFRQLEDDISDIARAGEAAIDRNPGMCS